MNLRLYQKEALSKIHSKFEAGVTRQLIALPTGTGKTVIFASLPALMSRGKKLMFLVHREELAQQAADKLKKWNPNLRIGVEMASSVANDTDDLVVASVQTIGRLGSPRLSKFKKEDFSVVVVDECHHSTAQTYLNVFDHFGLLSKENKLLLVGFTATPSRGDGTPLAKVYDEIIYQMTILEAIRKGWLVNLRAYRVATKTNLDDVHTVAGDFQQNELAAEVNTPERNDVVVRKWLEHAVDKKTVAFTVDIQHAKDLADRFKHYGIAAEAIWGDDPNRAEKLALHRAGHLKVLTNCGILTEGYDDPTIQCIILARPTKSGLLYTQMCGRGTRLPEGVQNLLEAKQQGVVLSKEECLIMDVVDNTSRHSLVTINSIFGIGKNLDPKKMTITALVDKTAKAKLTNPNLDLDKVTTVEQLDATVSEVDLWKVKFPQDVIDNSLLQWHQNTDRDSFVLLLPSKVDDKRESVAIVPNLLGTYAVYGSANGVKIKQNVPDVPTAFQVADAHIAAHAKEHLNLLKREAKWHAEPVTDNQLRLLRKFKLPIPDGLTKGDAQKKISQFLSRKNSPVTAAKQNIKEAA